MEVGLEDFDLDFMMLLRVCEILSFEGLLKDVIDKFVKYLEKKYRKVFYMIIF